MSLRFIATDDAPQSIWRPPLRRLTIGLVLVVVASAFEALAVATSMPATVRELGDLGLYGWTFSAFLLANLVGITLGGSESDRAGPARVIFAGTLLFVAGLAISGFAPSMGVIVAGRALQGVGAGLLWSSAYAAIAQAYSVDAQPRMLATLSSAWVIPGLIGPGIAGVVTEHASWRWVFLALTPLPVIATALVLPALRALSIARAPRSSEDRARIAQALQLGIGASVALGGLGLELRLLGLAIALVGAALALHALQRLLPPGTLLARAGLPAAIFSMALLNFAFFGAEAFVPLALSRVRQASVLLAGSALTAAAISWTTGAWLPVRLAGRIGRRAIILIGLGVLSLGLAGMLALLDPRVPVALAVVAWAVAGLGMGLAFTTLSAAILESAEPGRAGFASASLQLSQVLGAALATGVGGAIVAAPFAGDPPRLGILAVDLLMLGAALLAMLSARRGPD